MSEVRDEFMGRSYETEKSGGILTFLADLFTGDDEVELDPSMKQK